MAEQVSLNGGGVSWKGDGRTSFAGLIIMCSSSQDMGEAEEEQRESLTLIGSRRAEKLTC